MSTQTLFRLVSINPPQLLSQEQKTQGFIHHPDLQNSSFYQAVENETTHEDIHNALNTEASSFTPYDNYEDVRAINSDLYDFSYWLGLHLKSMTIDELNSKTASLTQLTASQKLELWDNLFYQLVTNGNNNIVDAINSMLVGDSFLAKYSDFMQNTSPTPTEFSEGDKKKFVRIGRSKVVIPKKIGLKKDKPASGSESQEVKFSMALYERQYADIALARIDELSTADEELSKALIKYEKEIVDEEKAFYKSKASQLMDDQETREGSFGSRMMRPLDRSTFTPSKDFDKSFTSGLVSSKSQKIFENLTSNPVSDNLANEALEKIQKSKREYYSRLFNTIEGQKAAIINGSSLDLKTRPKNNMFSFTLEPLADDDSKFSLFVTQYFSTVDNQMRKISADVTLPGSTVESDSGVKKAYKKNNYITYELFKDGLSVSSTDELDISISVEDVSGTELDAQLTALQPKDVAMAIAVKSSTASSISSPPLYGVTNLGIATYRKVEQEICNYVEGEVSHIENILAKEYKERETRSLTRSQVTSTEETEEETEQKTDTSTTDRFEMQSEVEQVIEEERSREFGWNVNASVGYGSAVGGLSVQVNGGAFGQNSSSTSSSQSSNESIDQAKEIVEKTLQRVVQKTKSKRTSIMLKEFEEINKHGFDNREGTSHVTGVFRWIDKMMKNKLVNYGRRLMFEFSIPEPARNFKQSLQNVQSQHSDLVILERPPHPSDFEVYKPEDLNLYNYAKLAGVYGAEVGDFPEERINLSKSYSESGSGTGLHGYNLTKSHNDFLIPPGYECFKIRVNGNMIDVDGDQGWPEGWVYVGDRFWEMHVQGWIISHTETLDHKMSDILPVSIVTRWAGAYTATVTALCARTEAHLKKWQINTYKAIMEAYNAKREQYNQQMNAFNSQSVSELTINPAFSRSIEMKELKRISIELMTRPYGIQTARNNYLDANANNVSKVNATEEFEKHASHVRFMEQAFDWELMSYNFYPYYWSDESKWHELMNSTNNADAIFQAFLQSGMARAVVPVRKGFEEAVNLYMETGTIWNGQGFTLDSEDDLYLSIEEELETPEGELEDTWMSRVPTALKIIQEQSAALPGDGLPSFCEGEDALATGTSTLGGSTEPTP